MKDSGNIEITIKPEQILQPMYEILNQSSKNVLFGLQLIDSTDTVITREEITSEDTFFSFGFNESTNIDPLLSKSNFKIWLLQKGFEELIKAINLTLIEAYCVTSLISGSTRIRTVGDFETKLEEFKKTAGKLNIPNLISEIEMKLTAPLLYKSEILSLNKARNCLVHRNGFVTDKDTNDALNTELRIEYSRMRLFYKNDLEEIEVVKGEQVPVGSGVQFGMIKESFNFHIGNKIELNYPQFNFLLTTCFIFGQDLLSKIPAITKIN